METTYYCISESLVVSSGIGRMGESFSGCQAFEDGQRSRNGKMMMGVVDWMRALEEWAALGQKQALVVKRRGAFWRGKTLTSLWPAIQRVMSSVGPDLLTTGGSNNDNFRHFG
jgi:hypothetical protein